MPLQCVPLRSPLQRLAGRGAVRHLHTTRWLADDVDTRNHYEILNVRQDASPGDIKRAFYDLSKTHHPDHNPHDPHAARRFMRISEAYSTLAHREKRAAYDRDVLHRNPSWQHGRTARPRGSYHSTGPAGGRPASGLSRRRGTFQGPPPSFFRSGGWGSHSAKRKTAHQESTGGGGGGGGAMPGMGPGDDPYGHRDSVPHFDREAHQRSQEKAAERRASARQPEPVGPQGDPVAGFLVIAGILTLSILSPFIVFRSWQGSGAEKANESRQRSNARGRVA